MSETVYYSLEEVAKNDGKQTSNTWLIFHDNVYDLTTYLEEHPGGPELVTEWAGKDGTKAFDDFGHSGDAKKYLKNFKIGEIREEERKKKQNKNSSPKVVEAVSKEGSTRSCISIISCGLCG